MMPTTAQIQDPTAYCKKMITTLEIKFDFRINLLCRIILKEAKYKMVFSALFHFHDYERNYFLPTLILLVFLRQN